MVLGLKWVKSCDVRCARDDDQSLTSSHLLMDDATCVGFTVIIIVIIIISSSSSMTMIDVGTHVFVVFQKLPQLTF